MKDLIPRKDCGWAEQGAEDMEADAMLNNYCKADAEKLCADIEPGAGRTQACLMSMVRPPLPPPHGPAPAPGPGLNADIFHWTQCGSLGLHCAAACLRRLRVCKI